MQVPRVYDPCLTCALCDAYLNGACDVLNELLAQLVPLVERVAVIEQIGWSVGKANVDVLKAEALEHVYFKLIDRELIPTHDPTVFSRYLWTMIKHAMLHSLDRDAPDIFDYRNTVGVPEEVCIYGRVRQHSDADYQLEVEQLREIAMRIFTADLRFEGRERDACLFMASCMVGIIEASPSYAKFRYRLSVPRYRFLENYTSHLLQLSLEEAKESDERCARQANAGRKSTSLHFTLQE